MVTDQVPRQAWVACPVGHPVVRVIGGVVVGGFAALWGGGAAVVRGGGPAAYRLTGRW